MQSKVPKLEKITADIGYKNTFVNYVNTEYKLEVEIERGRPVKSQNQLRALFLKKIDAAMELASRKELRMAKFYQTADAGAGSSEMSKKLYFQQKPCYKSPLYRLLSTDYNSKTIS